MAKKKTSAGFSGRRSKIDPFAAEVGTVSDKEIAAKAGVSTENVRTWRKRRGIPASWRNGDGTALGVAREASVSKKASRGKKPRRRKSRLDPYHKDLGLLPDKQVAELAGVSPENVRAYRKRHGIKAQWQSAVTHPAVQAVATPSKSPKTALAPATKPTGLHDTRRSWAFRVTADVGGEEKEYVTLGADVVEAARVALERLAAAHADAFVRKIEVVGVAL